MKNLLTILFLIIFANACLSQQIPGVELPKGILLLKDHRLSSIETELMRGDKNALFDLAPYLDSTKTLTEFLGYHILQTPEKAIAQRYISENCVFLDGELKIDTALSYKKFIAFLHGNYNSIHFDNDANAFLITPLGERHVKYELRQLTASGKDSLKTHENALLQGKWVQENNIASLIADKDPYALFKIASALYKNRERFNYYLSNSKDYIQLLQILTGVEIGVEDDQHKINYHPDADFWPDSWLNLLIYFDRNYKLYHWDETQKLFINPAETPQQEDFVLKNFRLLGSKTDSIAIHAFIRLTTCDPKRVAEVGREYEKAGIEKNDSLPIFPYKFLLQIPLLTEYYRAHDIDFTGSELLRMNIYRLKQKMTFAERHKLEDQMANTMSLEDITAFEYWGLIYETNWELTYSEGRILDIFYSNNWNSIINNPKQLDLYLKKSVLYERMGIIGVCNNYLKKFIGGGPAVRLILSRHTATDETVKGQVKQAIAAANKPIRYRPGMKKTFDGNHDSTVYDLRNKFFRIIKTEPDSEKRDQKIGKLLAWISYRQIGTAIKLVEPVKFKYEWYKYPFVESDFGFFMDNFDDAKDRANFLFYYSKHTQQQVYEHYLYRAGIDYRQKDGAMDFDKIYELLKYDVSDAFVGGGGGKDENEVYCIVKLLELKFKTTLGFPVKLCNSQGTYGCYADDRASLWMRFLEVHHLLKRSHRTPVSFTYE